METNNNDKEMKAQPKRGLWKPEEDLILRNYIETHGEGNWATVSKRSGLTRGGKSCRLRWKNYLRPNIKRGEMSKDEEDLIIRMHKLLGNRWSLIAGRLPGRTDNEVKNYWNTHLNRKSILGKRKTVESNKQHLDNDQIQLQDDSKKPSQLHTCNSQPIFSTSPKRTTDEGLGLDEKKELKEESSVVYSRSALMEESNVMDSSSWMERAAAVQWFNYDYDMVETPLMMQMHPDYSTLLFDEEPDFAPHLDSFVLFEAFGADLDAGIQSLLP